MPRNRVRNAVDSFCLAKLGKAMRPKASRMGEDLRVGQPTLVY
jgi:hypothetical protein